jgi:conjugative transfer signal peptidase TraF
VKVRARGWIMVLLTGLGTAALVWPSVHSPVSRIVYNASDSVPRGWYRVRPAGPLHVGGIVLARLPPSAAALAAQRGYLPERIPLLKPIGAMSPQQVCVQGGIVHIDGVALAAALTVDRLGRRLPVWRQCRALHVDELFLLSTTNPASFDSRYFGPVTTSAVIGTARPLWTSSTP